MSVDIRKLRALAEQLRMLQPPQPPAPRVAGRSWYRIEAKAGAPSAAEVYLYAEIGMWGITAEEFVDDLRAIDASSIDLHVNSPGGEVFDGLAIYESLINHKATVKAIVDGLAASSASFIVQAADEIEIAPRARMMIHDAHGITIGNATDMRSMADLLDDLSDNIAAIYAERAGGTRASWRAAMQASDGGPDGTWYDAERAVAARLADSVRGGGAQDRMPAGRPAGRVPGPAEQWHWNPAELAAVVDGGLDTSPPPYIPTSADIAAMCTDALLP